MNKLKQILEHAETYDRELPAPRSSMTLPQGSEIAAWIDHTLLKPEATPEQVKKVCAEAREFQFAAVCVNPTYVGLVSSLLAGSGVKTCVTVGFPLGATLASVKVFEALACLEVGANEVDMVINIGALKGGAYDLVFDDIQAVAEATHAQSGIFKVILETALLTRKEKIIACLLSEAAGAEFVKTSTGFGPGGATVEDVDLMYRLVGPNVKVKASGGIRDYATSLAMIRAGASRLGVSAGVHIFHEAVE